MLGVLRDQHRTVRGHHPTRVGGPGQVGYVSLTAKAALLSGSVPTIALTRRLLDSRIPDRADAVAYLILLGIILTAIIATMVF